VLVHATPWSVEDVVLPDAPEETAQRMRREADARVLPLLQPLAAERMEAYRVGHDVGTPANDRPDLVAPLG
jgi:putative SOS response-associated peptidase YedK